MLYINEEKLSHISLSKDNFAILMDFDRTITSKDSLGSWSVLENPKFMNENFRLESKKLVDIYYPYELDYSISNDVKAKYLNEWYYKNMDLLYEYNLTKSILLNCINDCNTKFHDGCKEFLYYMYKLNIPIIIISAGIGNVIIELLKKYDCLYSNINVFSNFIQFENDKMLHFSGNMIHTSNKSMSVLPLDLKTKILSKDYVLVFGDLIEDLDMAKSIDFNKVLSFGFLEYSIKENLNFYRQAFDVVLTDGSSFFEVQKILNNILYRAD